VITMTLAEVAECVDGILAGGADPDAVVSAPVAFDSRRVESGGLFLALPGERTDGHDHAAAAVAAGAVAILATRALDVPCVVVSDGLTALAALAREVLQRLPDIVVIGVTGSSGKTSTKDLMATLLSELGPTVAPAGSFNNELGHPFTVLQATTETRFLVLEKSARGIGHIAFLTSIAPPRIGVVLNVGTAHVGEFGSREAIATAKGELVEALPDAADGGIAVLNADDPAVVAMAGRTTARVVLVGESAAADLRADGVSLDRLGRPSFTMSHRGQWVSVAMKLTGEHHVANALAAAAVALECGMSLTAAGAILSSASARSRWRMEITERADGVVIVNDAYNANPESMRAALKTLAAMSRGRRGWAVLGEMAELGDQAWAEHDALGRTAVRLDIAHVIAVGSGARSIAQGAALEGSWDGESVWVEEADEALALVRARVQPGDVVLIKASRSVGLERLAAALIDDRSTTTGTAQVSGG
jgi:UDP-N-acetylmuramoyl-tripeptide--D-alanyl-D-alanine ligase